MFQTGFEKGYRIRFYTPNIYKVHTSNRQGKRFLGLAYFCDMLYKVWLRQGYMATFLSDVLQIDTLTYMGMVMNYQVIASFYRVGGPKCILVFEHNQL